jgi:hypothetical protein
MSGVTAANVKEALSPPLPDGFSLNGKIIYLNLVRIGGWRRDRTADLWVMNPPL